MAFTRRICWAVIATGILAGPGAVVARTYGGGIGITTNASADSVTVGERLRVVHEITYPDSLTLLPPDRVEAGTCRLLSSEWKEEKKDQRVTATGRLEVVTTNLEKAFLPGMTFRFVTPSGDTLTARGDDVEAGVRRVTTEKSEPKPLKPQWQAPRGWGFLLWIAGALVLAALAFWLIRRRRRRPVAKPVEPDLPADVVAYRRLDEIERMKLVEKGEIKPHYTLVVDALRSYLERRYLILALDQTTDEILRDLRQKNEDTAEIEPVLREADLVKFAKYKPEIEAAKRIIPAVRAIVAKTAYRALAGAPTDAEERPGSGGAAMPPASSGGALGSAYASEPLPTGAAGAAKAPDPTPPGPPPGE